jgi:hypothetical protein
MLLESDHHGPEEVRLLLALFSRVAHHRFLVGLILVFAGAAALLVFVVGGNSVGATRYVSLVFAGRCSVQMRVPVSLQLWGVSGYPGPLSLTGDGLPRGVIGSCVPRGNPSRIAAVGAAPGSAEKLSNGAYVAQLREDGGSVTYVAPLAGGAIAFGQAGDSVNAAVVYLVTHTRGRILSCVAGATGCAAKSTGPRNAVALKPPSGLSDARRATFLAGAAVAAESGCEGCHRIGASGNNGPGPPLTHIGSVLRSLALDAALRNPTAPMPSFADLAQTSPEKFHELIQFLAMLK